MTSKGSSQKQEFNRIKLLNVLEDTKSHSAELYTSRRNIKGNCALMQFFFNFILNEISLKCKNVEHKGEADMRSNISKDKNKI